jgi:hypothetical protein
MPLDQRAIIAQIDDILDHCEKVKNKSRHSDLSDIPEDASEAVNLVFAAIERLAPTGSSYSINAEAYKPYLTLNIGHALRPLLGILRALRLDYKSHYFQSVTELVHADVFADFLDMADYLLREGYKDPAAIIVGSVLEEHLRKLCRKGGITIVLDSGAPKKADLLNSELAAAQTYPKLDQKNVTAWLDLRNKAAHGEYTGYTKEQVALMHQGVRHFITRFLA